MRIVYWTRMPVAREQILAGLDGLAGIELQQVEDVADVVAALPGADGLITFDAPPPLARQVMDAARLPGATLRWMHIIPSGREGYTEAGIPEHLMVTGADGAHSPTVSEHAMALLLSLARAVPQSLGMSARAAWDRKIGDVVRSLEGLDLLVIGTGPIGRAIAEKARLFRMKATGISRSARPAAEFDRVLPLAELDAALPQADVVAIAVALAPETRGLLDARRIGLMKKGAILVNVARGAIVDTDALTAALQNGQLGGAGLDVTEPEPLPDGHPLWSAPNVIITPHVAGFGSEQSRRRLAEAAIKAVRRHLDGA